MIAINRAVCYPAVAGFGLPVCPREARLSVALSAGGGYLSNAVGPYRWYVGTDVCPWRLTARSGQKIYLRTIVLNAETTPPMKTDDTVACSAVYVIKVCFEHIRWRVEMVVLRQLELLHILNVMGRINPPFS